MRFPGPFLQAADDSSNSKIFALVWMGYRSRKGVRYPGGYRNEGISGKLRMCCAFC